MNVTVTPGVLRGTLAAAPAKAYAHRLLILAAFAQRPTELHCPGAGKDIMATAQCLRALGAEITAFPWGFHVTPAREIPGNAALPCGESGSTLRFLLPVVGALGVSAEFITEGRLGSRPLEPLWGEMQRMGCRLHWEEENRLRCTGKLNAGHYRIAGNVSSQFITGLQLGLQLLPVESTLEITGTVESAPYLEITKDTLAMFGLETDTLGGRTLRSPGKITVEGDWSNAAFFLGANALGSQVTLCGLNPESPQGDRAVSRLLEALEADAAAISGAQIPDLIPILAVVAAAKHGAVFTQIRRLRLKESDRVAAIGDLLSALGIRTDGTEDTLRVYPGRFAGGTVDPRNDHRIAMAAAVAALAADGPVTIADCECVAKSYPGFWDDFKLLGGQYAFHVR